MSDELRWVGEPDRSAGSRQPTNARWHWHRDRFTHRFDPARMPVDLENDDVVAWHVRTEQPLSVGEMNRLIAERQYTDVLSIVLVGLVCMICFGCGKKGGSGGSQKGPLSEAQSAATNVTLMNDILHDFVVKQKVILKDINELVTSGFVPSLPTAPPGKKFAIQLLPINYTVVLENE